jgi:hypothetical protein
VNLTDRLEVSDDVVVRDVGGETVLLDLASGTYFGLDAVGARIWQLIEDEGATLAGACDVIAEEYDVTREELERDVLALAGQLAEHGLIAAAGQ